MKKLLFLQVILVSAAFSMDGLSEKESIDAAIKRAIKSNVDLAKQRLNDPKRDINEIDYQGYTVLDILAYQDRTPKSSKTIQLLVENGAKVNGHHGHTVTPLMWSAYHGIVDEVRLLLEYGADPNAKNHHETALGYAESGFEQKACKKEGCNKEAYEKVIKLLKDAMNKDS